MREPDLMHEIVAQVRQALPASVPVTAKMRLGYDDRSMSVACAQALEAAGAEEIVIHARSKVDGYKPPAYWEEIARAREAVVLARKIGAAGEFTQPTEAIDNGAGPRAVERESAARG